MKFTKFALTLCGPKETGNTNFLGRITIYLPDSRKSMGDIQANLFLTAEGISVSNSCSGGFTTKFGIRTELAVDELRTISNFCLSRGLDIVTILRDTQKTRRQTYSLSTPFGVDIPEPTSLIGGDYYLPSIVSTPPYNYNAQVPMDW